MWTSGPGTAARRNRRSSAPEPADGERAYGDARARRRPRRQPALRSGQRRSMAGGLLPRRPRRDASLPPTYSNEYRSQKQHVNVRAKKATEVAYTCFFIGNGSRATRLCGRSADIIYACAEYFQVGWYYLLYPIGFPQRKSCVYTTFLHLLEVIFENKDIL